MIREALNKSPHTSWRTKNLLANPCVLIDPALPWGGFFRAGNKDTAARGEPDEKASGSVLYMGEPMQVSCRARFCIFSFYEKNASTLQDA